VPPPTSPTPASVPIQPATAVPPAAASQVETITFINDLGEMETVTFSAAESLPPPPPSGQPSAFSVQLAEQINRHLPRGQQVDLDVLTAILSSFDSQNPTAADVLQLLGFDVPTTSNAGASSVAAASIAHSDFPISAMPSGANPENFQRRQMELETLRLKYGDLPELSIARRGGASSSAANGNKFLSPEELKIKAMDDGSFRFLIPFFPKRSCRKVFST